MVQVQQSRSNAQLWSPIDLDKATTLDNVLESSTIICNALRSIGSVSGVPFLSEAGAVALRILTIVKVRRGYCL